LIAEKPGRLNTGTTKNLGDTSVEEVPLNDEIVECIRDLKGINIVKIDLRRLHDAPTDFFIICEGTSTTQIRAIASHIRSQVMQILRIKPDHVEGEQSSMWICVDYFNTVVHIFHPDTRKYYGLEDLWSDAETVQYENL